MVSILLLLKYSLLYFFFFLAFCGEYFSFGRIGWSWKGLGLLFCFVSWIGTFLEVWQHKNALSPIDSWLKIFDLLKMLLSAVENHLTFIKSIQKYTLMSVFSISGVTDGCSSFLSRQILKILLHLKFLVSISLLQRIAISMSIITCSVSAACNWSQLLCANIN